MSYTYSGTLVIPPGKFSSGIFLELPDPGFPDSNYSVSVNSVEFENANVFVRIRDETSFWVGGNAGTYLWIATNQNGSGGGGEPGPAGPTGATGTVYTPRGSYYYSLPPGSPVYLLNDLVVNNIQVYDGGGETPLNTPDNNTYVCIQSLENPYGAPGPLDPNVPEWVDYWRLFVSGGAPGPQGPAGQSSSLYPYLADNADVPRQNHISWSNFSSQISSTFIRVNHIDQSGDDIDVFLALIKEGDTLIIQDDNVSGSFQKWLVSGTPVHNSTPPLPYWEFPVTLVSSEPLPGYNFTINQQLLLIVLSSGVVGPPGPTGTFEFSGPTGSILWYDGSAVTGTTGFTWTETGGMGEAYRLTGGPNGNFIDLDASGYMSMNINSSGAGKAIGLVAGNTSITLTDTVTNEAPIPGELQVQINGINGDPGQVLTSDGFNTIWSTPSASMSWAWDGAGLTGSTVCNLAPPYTWTTSIQLIRTMTAIIPAGWVPKTNTLINLFIWNTFAGLATTQQYFTYSLNGGAQQPLGKTSVSVLYGNQGPSQFFAITGNLLGIPLAAEDELVIRFYGKLASGGPHTLTNPNEQAYGALTTGY